MTVVLLSCCSLIFVCIYIVGVKENAIFMKEIEDGMKVQKQILERLEAASSILAQRKRLIEAEYNKELKNGLVSKVDDKNGKSTSNKMKSFYSLSNSEISAYEQKIIGAKTIGSGQKEQEEVSKLLHWVVIGGGPTGVELVAELSDFVRYVLP